MLFKKHFFMYFQNLKKKKLLRVLQCIMRNWIMVMLLMVLKCLENYWQKMEKQKGQKTRKNDSNYELLRTAHIQ